MTYADPISALLGDWSAQISGFTVLFRIALALLFAAIIGCERAHKRHSAGLRTFILVMLTTATAMLADLTWSSDTAGHFPIISAAAVIGIAIISANSFLYSSKSQIKGLTTAVAMWACGFIGLALGGGFYTVAIVMFTATLLCLSVLPALERYLKDRSNHFEIHLELKYKNNLQDFLFTIRRLGLRIDDIEYNPAYANSGLSVYSISITITRAELKKYKKHSEIIEALASLEYVSHIEEML